MSTAGTLLLNDDATPSGWQLDRQGAHAELRLIGCWIVGNSGIRDPAAIGSLIDGSEQPERIRLDTAQLGRWDSALIVFLQELRLACAGQKIELDETGLPVAARRLLALAAEAEQTAPCRIGAYSCWNEWAVGLCLRKPVLVPSIG